MSDDARPFTVLLADDKDVFRESMRLWLADDDRWAVREASNGREALAELDETVDVLVLDRQMPALSGPEVVERLDETAFEGAVVVLTAFEPDANLDEADVTSYLTKPIDRQEFIYTLDRHA